MTTAFMTLSRPSMPAFLMAMIKGDALESTDEEVRRRGSV